MTVNKKKNIITPTLSYDTPRPARSMNTKLDAQSTPRAEERSVNTKQHRLSTPKVASENSKQHPSNQ
jgi:hypothetical protein